MDCPNCKLVNPPTAARCDCGYDFQTHTMKRSYLTEQNQSRGFWVFSKRDLWVLSKEDAWWFIFGYIVCFLGFRFDMFHRYGPWFQHAMPTARAAWVALPLALVIAVLVKIRSVGDRAADE